MKRDMEQMAHWVQELRAPLGNLMGQLELHREEMAPECFGQLWEDCQNLRENVEQVLELVSMRLGDRLPQWGRRTAPGMHGSGAESEKTAGGANGRILSM